MKQRPPIYYVNADDYHRHNSLSSNDFDWIWREAESFAYVWKHLNVRITVSPGDGTTRVIARWHAGRPVDLDAVPSY